MKAWGVLTVLAGALVLEEGTALGMSCAALADHYLLVCDQRDCQPLFRAVEASSYGQCGRTMRIEPFPDWAKAPILEIIRTSVARPDHPLVTAVRLSHHYPSVPATREEFTKALHPWSVEKVAQHAEGESEVRLWYLRRCAADASRGQMFVLRDGVLCSSALTLIIGSFMWLVIGLWRRTPGAETRRLAWALAIKASLMVIGVALIFLVFVVPRPLLLLAPVAVLFILLDAVACLFARWWWSRVDRSAATQLTPLSSTASGSRASQGTTNGI